jgi:cysteine-rich repeat protein
LNGAKQLLFTPAIQSIPWPYDNQWHFFAFTASRSTDGQLTSYKAYLDGIEQAGQAKTIAQHVTDNTSYMFIGSAAGGANKFTGLLDDLRMYKRELSAAEILELFTSLPPFGICGNTKPERNEECDDGNTKDYDGCTALCKKEPICGNGLPETGTICFSLDPNTGECAQYVPLGEECDDGNTIDTDGCISCKAPICGDGKTQTGVEQCDDTNTIDTDACVACNKAFCGDGSVESGVEECDLGNDSAGNNLNGASGQACTAECKKRSPDELDCEAAAGIWKIFPDWGVDSCADKDRSASECLAAETSGCECGELKCWDYGTKSCVNNPTSSSVPKGGWNWGN